jgi:MFS family permease
MSTTGERLGLRRARAAVTAAFATHAMLSGLLGPWVPELKARAGVDASGLGLALTAFAVGLLAGTRLAPPAVRRFGGRVVVRGGIAVLGAGFAVLGFVRSPVALGAAFAAVGVTAGLVDVAMNVEAVAVERRFGRRVMTAIHGTWSVALFVGAAIASVGIAVGVPIVVHLPLASALIVAAGLPFLRSLPRTADGPLAPERDGAADRTETGIAVALLCLIAAGSFLMEGIAMDWSAVYLRETLDASAGVAGAGVVAFSAGMAATRFVGDRFVARFGQPAVVRAGAGLATASLAATLAVPSVRGSIVAFALVGLGLGPVVPLVFRSAARLLRARGRDDALPIVVTAGYTGSIVGPLVVGFVADRVGLRVAFIVPLVAVALVAAAASATHER